MIGGTIVSESPCNMSLGTRIDPIFESESNRSVMMSWSGKYAAHVPRARSMIEVSPAAT